MKNNATEQLKQAMLELEVERAIHLEELKQSMQQTYNQFKPSNFIKNSLENVIASTELQDTLINGAVGLSTGFIAKKLLIKDADSIQGKVLSNLVQLVVTGLIVNNKEKFTELRSKAVQFLVDHFHSKPSSDKKQVDSELEKGE